MTRTTRPSSRDKLVGQKIAVIGGSSGIGFGCARVLLEHGAHITIISRHQAKVTAAVARLNALALPLALTPTAEPSASASATATATACPVTGHAADVRDEPAITALLQSLAPLDHIIVTAADRAIRGPLARTDLADAQALFGVKFWGSVVVAKALLAGAGAGVADVVTPGGSLTLTSGLAALRPARGAPLTGALNGGVAALTLGLAAELAAKRIRVNTVVPGLCRTEAWDRERGAGQQSWGPAALEEVLARGARESSVGFVGCPEDVAEAYLFLVRADYANGTTVVIDGGAHI